MYDLFIHHVGIIYSFSLFPFQLLSARDMVQRTFIGQDHIFYSTDKDLIEQDVEAGEWDRRFREIEKFE